MTPTRCVKRRTRLRSRATKRRARPISACSASSRARICAWIVTSSAVVGSSAISSFGRPASAIAIIARWRWPPESWCGQASTRRSGSGMPVLASSSIARARASARPRSACSASTSPIWAPTVCSGLSAVIGSWKIIAISPPRTARSSGSPACSRSRPAKRIAPVVSAPSTRPSTDSAVIDLPEPDSPTRANFSPAAMANDTSSTTGAAPKRTLRCSIERSASVRCWPSPAASAAPCRRRGRRRCDPLPRKGRPARCAASPSSLRARRLRSRRRASCRRAAASGRCAARRHRAGWLLPSRAAASSLRSPPRPPARGRRAHPGSPRPTAAASPALRSSPRPRGTSAAPLALSPRRLALPARPDIR